MARRKRNSSKINLTISVVFHTALLLAISFLAAREGMLGKRLKELTVVAVKEKKPEPPKEKPPEPKTVAAKPPEAPKTIAAVPPPRVETASAPPPATATAPAAAPAAVDVPSLEFSDGAKEVLTISDPKLIYKGMVETALRAHWNRPEDVADDNYIAEVKLVIDPKGNVVSSQWVKGSGDVRWDNSVKAAVAATKAISRPPPKGFPGEFLARFDVELLKSEEVLRVSTR